MMAGVGGGDGPADLYRANPCPLSDRVYSTVTAARARSSQASCWRSLSALVILSMENTMDAQVISEHKTSEHKASEFQAPSALRPVAGEVLSP